MTNPGAFLKGIVMKEQSITPDSTRTGKSYKQYMESVARIQKGETIGVLHAKGMFYMIGEKDWEEFCKWKSKQ